MSTPPEPSLPPDVMQKLGDAAQEQGVTIVVVEGGGMAAVAAHFSAGVGKVIEENCPAPGADKALAGRIFLTNSGLGSSVSGRFMRIMPSVGLALAAATAMAQPLSASPRKKAASLFARIPHSAAPGMDKHDLQRLQRQHAQKANAKSRYRPR